MNKLVRIPLNELTDKIAKGWSVRRTCWSEGRMFGLNWVVYPSFPNISAFDLTKDDWEGYPPELYFIQVTEVSFVEAFHLLLKKENTYIRHTSFDKTLFLAHDKENKRIFWTKGSGEETGYVQSVSFENLLSEWVVYRGELRRRCDNCGYYTDECECSEIE